METIYDCKAVVADKHTAFVLGNGPSLKNISLPELSEYTTIGLNAAYRYWRTINWRPKHYACLDLVVGLSHKEAIADLIAEGRIHSFLLRENLVKELGAIGKSARVIDFDALKKDHDIFRPLTITTGSHAALWAAFMKFKKIVLLGIDGQYKELVDGAKKLDGTELEIIEKAQNPNYFFDEYQLPGDKYNVPNPRPDLHVNAWREIFPVIQETESVIYNGNPNSAVRCFPLIDIDQMLHNGTYPAQADEHLRFKFKPNQRPDITITRAEKKSALRISPDALPRLLVFDLTSFESIAATGQLKSTLFQNYPADKILQVFHVGPGKLAVFPNKNAASSNLLPATVKKKIDAFNPELILYRPTPQTEELHRFATAEIDRLQRPLITWIMDDWPVDHAKADPVAAQALHEDWRALLSKSAARLSICNEMSIAFKERYNEHFIALANAVTPAEWPQVRLKPALAPIRVRYAGSLAKNMTRETIKLIAEAVEVLAQEGLELIFEIKTRKIWHDQASKLFKGLKSTQFILDGFTPEEYRAWLCDADIVVIGYNFDEESIDYTRYSLANKLPEYLASGAALFSAGPEDIAPIALLKRIGVGVCVTSNDLSTLSEALRPLVTCAEHRFNLGKAAQDLAFERFNIADAEHKLFQITHTAAAEKQQRIAYRRAEKAHVDETAVIATLLSGLKGPGSIMIDIGAHFGTSATYFHKLGWRLYCFEPDPNNRQHLISKLGDAPNVTIDSRGVSNAPASNVPFFTSEESTGISGLSIFTKGHKQTGTVDLTTIREIVLQHRINEVTFLKIDVEGFDLSVLKGVPWGDLRPEIIECEFEDSKTIPLGHTWRDIAEYLINRGYTIYISEWYPIKRYGLKHDWRRIIPYENAEIPADAWGNLLAFQSDPGYDAVADAFKTCIEFGEGSKSNAPAIKPQSAASHKDVNVITPKITPVISPGHRPNYKETFAKRLPNMFKALKILKSIVIRIWTKKKWMFATSCILGAYITGSYLLEAATNHTSLWRSFSIGLVGCGLIFLGRRVYQYINALSAEIAQLRRRLENTAKTSKAMVHQLDNMEKNVPHINDLSAEIAQLRRKIGDTAKTSKAMVHQLDNMEKNVPHINDLSAEIAQLRRKIGDTAKTSEAIVHQLDNIERAQKIITRNDKLTTYNRYEIHSRHLIPEDLSCIKNEWLAPLDLTLSNEEILYLAHQIRLDEAKCEGRMATTIQAALLRTLALLSLKKDTIELLEIGTLFGIASGSLFRAGWRAQSVVNLSLIDPLEGYYQQSPKDYPTGVHVTRQTLDHNLQCLGLKPENYRVIEKLSTDPEALRQAKERRYDYILIDGDHSLKGLQRDFELYAPLVTPGGVLIIDDYDTTDWPEIKPFVDTQVKPHEDWRWIGGKWRTAIFRRK